VDGDERGGGGGGGVYCGTTAAALFALSLRGTRDGRGARWRAREELYFAGN